jgi:hypothetical protein
MAKTGFFDAGQGIYLPKDSLTWDDLGSAPYSTWDNWTGWYQNLSTSTTVEFTTDIIDFGSEATVLPLITITTLRDGTTSTAAFLEDDKPSITIEGSNVANMSSGVSSITLTKDTDPYFSTIGKFRYYRFTFNINSGINTAPQGFTGFDITLDTEPQEEIVENFDTSTVDDGSSTTRVVPLRKIYSSVNYVGITPTLTITDDEETAGGGIYVADNYVNSDYVSSDASTEITITTLPLGRFVSANTNSVVSTTITIQLLKPNTGEDVNSTVDLLVKGLPLAAMDIAGNVVRV